jgi:hypothetical protein
MGNFAMTIWNSTCNPCFSTFDQFFFVFHGLKHFFLLFFRNQFPFRILFRILSVIVVNCNLIISVVAAWPIKFTEGSKSGNQDRQKFSF